MIDVVILNFNDADTVIEQLNSIKSYKIINKVLIVDNMSTDNSFEKLKKFANDRIILISSKKNGGYGYGNNVGIKYLVEHFNSKFILLANPDVIYQNETLLSLRDFLLNNKDFAIVAPFMLDSNMIKQNNTALRIPNKIEFICSFGIVLNKLFKTDYYKNLYQEEIDFKIVDAVAGSLFLMDAKKMVKYGMFDEKIFLYCEELVIGLKMKKAKLKTALLLNDYFIHNHSISINKTYKSNAKKRKLLIESKLYVLKHYYNSNMIDLILAKIIGNISIFECNIISFF